MAEPSRLCLVLERVAEEVHEPEFVATLPLVGFEAFVPGSRVFGWVRLDADRLTDMLNAHEELHLVNVLVENLDGGATVTADEAIVRRGELVGRPRQRPARRRLPPGAHADPPGRRRVGTLPGRGPSPRARPGPTRWSGSSAAEPMVPLTTAWIAYRPGATTSGASTSGRSSSTASSRPRSSA